jgi:hypothetical protein
MNQPNKAREHFYGLQEAKHDLVGFALFDRLDQQLQERPELREYMWRKREIENYFCHPEALGRYAEALDRELGLGPLFQHAEREKKRKVMQECIEDYIPKAALRDPSARWWSDTKVSDEFFDPLFEAFFKKLGLPNLMSKTDYHVLAEYVAKVELDAEVATVLDAIVEAASKAVPTT